MSIWRIKRLALPVGMADHLADHCCELLKYVGDGATGINLQSASSQDQCHLPLHEKPGGPACAD